MKTTGIELITKERERQMESEGYSLKHDDGHSGRELARLAQGYIGLYVARSWIIGGLDDGLQRYQAEPMPEDLEGDMDPSWWKPKNPLRDLVRAGALIAAEIDRIARVRDFCSRCGGIGKVPAGRGHKIDAFHPCPACNS